MEIKNGDKKQCDVIIGRTNSTSLSNAGHFMIFSEREGQKLDGIHQYR